MTYVIASNRTWHKNLPKKLANLTNEDFVLIDKKEDLTLERLQNIQPEYVFFLHWSYIIPAEIYQKFECVIFHMTDVPFGCGGSPLQNLIARGIYETKISALKCQAELDAGPVYMKKPFYLHGTAAEIYIRATKIAEKMIIAIIKEKPVSVEQQGDVVCFKRRQSADGNIADLTSLEQIYDYIRMLDAEGYPNAFLETEQFRFEFQRASLKYGHIVADVKIIPKKEKI